MTHYDLPTLDGTHVAAAARIDALNRRHALEQAIKESNARAERLTRLYFRGGSQREALLERDLDDFRDENETELRRMVES